MNENKNILGCFFKVGFDPKLNEQDFVYLADTFKAYIWGEKGIGNTLKKLEYKNYGKDLKLILFQFNVKPTQIELQKLKEIEPYRAKEKAIGIPIIVNDENFFSKTNEERYNFLNQSIFKKLDLLVEVVKKKKLDTKMDLLREDVEKLMNL